MARAKKASSTWRKANKEKVSEQGLRFRLKSKYGLTPEQVENMLAAQKGTCAICTTPITMRCDDKSKAVHVDHCHTTLKVRGLLCNKCNRAIGMLREDVNVLENAIAYLEKSQ